MCWLQHVVSAFVTPIAAFILNLVYKALYGTTMKNNCTALILITLILIAKYPWGFLLFLKLHDCQRCLTSRPLYDRLRIKLICVLYGFQTTFLVIQVQHVYASLQH